MKKAIILLITMACIFSLAGCSNYENDMVGNPTAPGSNLMSSVGKSGTGGAMSDSAYSASDSADVLSSAEHERKVIRDAHMTIESDNAVELFANLSAFNRSLGGYEFSNQTQHFDTFTSVEAVLKVPPEKLDEFMNYAGESGKIVRSGTTSDDVTDSYYDMQTRVETKRRTLESYYTLLEKAETSTEIITIQRTIDSIIEDIEAFEGRLRVMDSLVDMATVKLYISQKNDPVLEERREIDWNALTLDDMGYFIRNGFVSVVLFIVSIFQWAVIALVVASPVWILPVIVIIVLLRRRRKNRKALTTFADKISETSSE